MKKIIDYTRVIASLAACFLLLFFVVTWARAAPSTSPAVTATQSFPFFEGFDSIGWTQLANMPFSTADQTAAAVNNKVYIIGGYNTTSTNPLNINYQFDPVTNTYTQKANMPTARWGLIAAPVSNIIYVLGGNQAGATVSAANEAYNPATNVWQTKASLPAAIAHQGITGCSDGTDVYLFYDGLTYRYNVAANSYTQLANMPNNVLSWGSCSYVNGKIYLLGGYKNGGQPYTQIYDKATNTWTTGAPMPFGTYGSIRENPVIGNDIYILQGQRRNSEFSSRAYVYHTTTDTWSERSFGPHAADGVAGAVYDGKIYTFGGRQDITGPYGLNYATTYDPSLDTEDSPWRQIGGNFEVSDGMLREMSPSKGAGSGSILPQLQTRTYQLPASFTLEAQSTQTVSGSSWNSLAIHTNNGEYNVNLNGYLMPYNDYGITPAQTILYRETGTSYTQLATRPAATGRQRYKIVSTPSNLTLYQNNASTLTTSDTTYRGGYLNIIASPHDTSTWDFILVQP
jgi:N-acetylneuraminic acid mutarotase